MDRDGPRVQPPQGHGRAAWRGSQVFDSAAPLPPPSAISSILGTWLDQYSEDFYQPPGFPCLKQLVAYVQLNMPGSDLERRAHLLLAQLERTELTEAELEGEENGGRPWGGVSAGHRGTSRGWRGAGQEQRLVSDHPPACGWGSVLG